MADEPASAAESALRADAVRCVGWSTVAQVSRQAVQFVVGLGLARILVPEDFGLVAMVMVFVTFTSLFADLGFSASLVQRQGLEDRHLESVFWLCAAVSALLAAAFAALGSHIVSFYGEARLAPVAALLAFHFPLTAAGIVHKARLSRALAFKRIAIADTASVVLAGATALTLAASGFGVWAIVAQLLLVAGLASAGYWFATGWRPRLRVDTAAIRELSGFSRNLFGHAFFNHWARNADQLLIGRFLGEHALGLYARAYGTMYLPLTQVTGVVGHVMFPVLARLQKDRGASRRAYLRSLRGIALFSFPISLGLLVVAEHFVLAVYTEKWAGAIDTVRVLCVVGLVQSIAATGGWVFLATGRTDWMFRWGLAMGIASAASFAAGVSLGSVEAVALCYAALNIAVLYWDVRIPGRLIGVTFPDVLRSLAGIFACACGMAGCVVLLDRLVRDRLSHGACLAVEVAAGAAVYPLLLWLARVPALADALESLARLRGRAPRSAEPALDAA